MAVVQGAGQRTVAAGGSTLAHRLDRVCPRRKSSYQGRLFAQDALQGLRLIDLCREVFDVVVMNPPFGALSSSVKDQLSQSLSAQQE
jgi:hypothetical protein